MTRLYILAEGQSEELFVKKTLAPHLARFGVYASAKQLNGVSAFGKIRKYLLPLTGDPQAWTITLLDFYGLPRDFPGIQLTQGNGNAREHAIALQTQFADAISKPRFIPFLALHEFEAWLFCAPEIVAKHFAKPELVDMMRQAGAPEDINHGKSTHPKARLKNLKIGYKETADGPALLDDIGIETIRNQCPHFASWLSRLESLDNPPEEHHS
jgi:hypothetical protein